MKQKMCRIHNKKWMIVGVLTQFFEPVKMEILLKWVGPILGSKWTYLGSKIDIFEPICPKKWKMSGNCIKKWMILVLLTKYFKPIKTKIFL